LVCGQGLKQVNPVAKRLNPGCPDPTVFLPCLSVFGVFVRKPLKHYIHHHHHHHHVNANLECETAIKQVNPVAKRLNPTVPRPNRVLPCLSVFVVFGCKTRFLQNVFLWRLGVAGMGDVE
jgi:hypothetical protein